ncbi:MAG: hypothetical protein U1B83_07620, partial [Candidatus Cloacimonadaceae bacterium]|nr:hypothetical protein [Candidatus Cloacimonadaceae bacterium]
ELKVRPRGKFKIPGMKRLVRRNPTHAGSYEHVLYKDKIPTLLQSYLKVGAKVCGVPAMDKSFKCVDFLTLLHVKDIEKAYTRKMNQD